MQFGIPFKFTSNTASTVIVTGTFDGWAGTLLMDREDSDFALSSSPSDSIYNFHKYLALDGQPGDEIQYKFIVDGQWVCDDANETVYDVNGNLNNRLVLTAEKFAMEGGKKSSKIFSSFQKNSSLATLDPPSGQQESLHQEKDVKAKKVKWFEKVKKMFVKSQ
jgi:hypothetical protein